MTTERWDYICSIAVNATGALSVAWKGIDPTTSLWSIRASIAFTCEKWKHR